MRDGIIASFMQRLFPSQRPVQSGIFYPQDIFRTLLSHERARADRLGQQFSLLLCEVGDLGDSRNKVPEHLHQVLKTRLRTSDEAGIFDMSHIGIILSETDQEGALKLAKDLFNALASEVSTSPKWKIHTYPDKWFGRERPESEEENESAVEAENLFVCKVDHGQGVESMLTNCIPPWKRVIDVFGAIVAAILFSPAIVMMTVYIKLVSPGPILFRQIRIGCHGKPFTCYKFRTMSAGTSEQSHENHLHELMVSDTPLRKLDDEDPRIIPLGRMFRHSGLDELPQLINVFRGEMSLVGPRPTIPYEVREYQQWWKRRFDTSPGMTGLWQVTGKNKTTFKEMLRLDIKYSEKRSFWMDMIIFIRTLPAICKQMASNKLRKKGDS